MLGGGGCLPEGQPLELGTFCQMQRICEIQKYGGRVRRFYVGARRKSSGERCAVRRFVGGWILCWARRRRTDQFRGHANMTNPARTAAAVPPAGLSHRDLWWAATLLGSTVSALTASKG
jgi:hypothetical protein